MLWIRGKGEEREGPKKEKTSAAESWENNVSPAQLLLCIILSSKPKGYFWKLLWVILLPRILNIMCPALEKNQLIE